MKRFSNGNSSKGLISYIFRFIIIVVAVISICHYIKLNSSIYYRKSITLPFSMHLNRAELIMQKGDEFRLFVYGINLRVSYYSTNFRVAWVNFNGRVHAIGVGKTFIIAKVNGKELKCLVRVVDINKDQLTLHPGGSYDLDIKGVSDFLKWRSSNPKVASVSWTGRVIAKKKGTTVITAKIKRKIVKCTVVVK